LGISILARAVLQALAQVFLLLIRFWFAFDPLLRRFRAAAKRSFAAVVRFRAAFGSLSVRAPEEIPNRRFVFTTEAQRTLRFFQEKFFILNKPEQAAERTA
jgi:hypothetical protein